MSVKNFSEKKYRIFIKGSPEKIRDQCLKQTITNNFHEILDNYALNGFRVLALATRTLQISFKSIHKYEGEAFEKYLTFLGFLIINNRLKGKTISTIEKLHKVNIRTVMATGDNI